MPTVIFTDIFSFETWVIRVLKTDAYCRHSKYAETFKLYYNNNNNY